MAEFAVGDTAAGKVWPLDGISTGALNMEPTYAPKNQPTIAVSKSATIFVQIPLERVEVGSAIEAIRNLDLVHALSDIRSEPWACVESL
ncbi:MAG: hypothetical protein ACKVVP_00945 [Chloroflexota bacterium]